MNGIINIVRKKRKENGLHGSLAVNAGTKGRGNATASVNYTTGRISMFASYGIRRDYYEIKNTDERTRMDSTTRYVSQLTTGSAHPLSHIIRVGADWNISSGDRLQVNGGFNRRHFVRHDNIYATDRDAGQSIIYKSIRHRYDNENVRQWEAGTIYTHTFGTGRKLTADYYSYSSLKGLEDNQYATYTAENTTKDNTQIWQAYYQHLFRINYHHAWSGNLKLQLGYELDILQTDLNYHVQGLKGNIFVPDFGRSSDFTNDETNHALYATLEYIHGSWGVLLGLRPETMQIKSQLFTLDSIVKSNYFMIYPTLHISYAAGRHSELQLNYSLRVNRPEADDLNPFPEYQNPLTLKAGNPYLKPEKVHSLEASYQWKNRNATVLGTLYYRYVTNKLTTITRYVDNNILLTTKENMNSSSLAGAEIILNAEIGKWMTLNLNGNLFYDQIDATRLGYGKHKGTFAWSASLNANLSPFKNVLLQLNSRYLSPALMPQGRREGIFSTDISVKYAIPRLNLSFTATISDVFNTMKTIYTIDTTELRQHLEQRSNSRVFYLGVAWDFDTSKQ